ncbi:hypothetical protein BDY19DRAFT_987949 [Irpex rosettiformis]|uniref:Uncharacterized protein n=1 Tax=Irpex rosettiformis TaxID=378272 RepID=A0ACB8TMM3_9APHY|nr:hypothetical protein BDY19DRAFT_987949 [Irpex rosettiformis]
MDINMEGNEDEAWVDVKADAEELGVDETFIDAMQHMSRWNGHWRRIARARTWRVRVARQEEAWGRVLDEVIKAYVCWKYQSPDEVESIASGRSADNEPEQTYDYTVGVYDIFTRTTQLTIQRKGDSISPAIDLIRHGYLAKSPTRPSVAVAIATLELLYRLRQRKPSYSIEAFAKVVCDYYNIPYRRYLQEVFADTFEVYLRIIWHVHKSILEALGWGTPDWRVKNACRACCYKVRRHNSCNSNLENEPPLRFGRLIAMDGNNSLKRMATAAHRVAGDTRSLEDSDYFLSSDFVNRFANEVHGRATKGPAVKHKGQDSDEDSDEDLDGPETEGDPTDGLHPSNGAAAGNEAQDARRRRLALCVKNWKSAAKDEKKKMWAIFDESGVFAAACCHGFVLWIMDMVCSGELAKYPFAIVAKTLELLGERPLIGYNVGCTFSVTTERSSLGPAFTAAGGAFCVCAFHGYSHSYDCQLEFHPNVIEGAGLEDLETMERLFSMTNALASVTRYASPYRRRLFIEAYLWQLDEDKHLSLGTFLLNNYKQALHIVDQQANDYKQAMTSLGITTADLDQWEVEQSNFFSRLGEEEPYNVHAIAYVERLQELRDLDSRRQRANTNFLSYIPGEGVNYTRDLAATRRAETEHRHANERYERVYADVCALKIQMGLVARWTTTSPEYVAVMKYLKERKYQRALRKLQKLVTQRLFELQRLNVAQTGYKMRTHITKSLQTWCKAIQAAITSLNAAAAALVPPRPPINWSEIGGYQFLEQIRRAEEELLRLNVEVRRLHTAIRDERILFNQTLVRLNDTNDSLFGPVKEFIERRRRVNNHLLSRIHDIYKLPGFRGTRGPGTREGSAPPENGQDLDPDLVPDDDAAHDDEVDVLEGDEEQDALGHLVEFISGLSTS